jgi:hypothetical protein
MKRKISPAQVDKYLKLSLPMLEEGLVQDCIDAGVLSSTAKGDTKKSQQENVQKQISEAIKADEGRIKKLICTELNYCERISSERVKVIIDIVDAIVIGKITLLTALPIPLVRVTVYIVRKKMLDPLCDCKSVPKWA